MPLLRTGHRGILASLIHASNRRPQRRHVGLLTLCSLTAPSLAHAKPFRAVGVKAWTSGSETFIRARPSAEVPPVAKVERHTPIYVWGKYNGWYRVETHDHVFGWVFNRYIEAPKSYKVRAMPASKARLASNRTASQVMYGSPALLKQHYAVYGAPGALQGLRKQGVRLAIAPRKPAKSLVKPRIVLAKSLEKSSVKPKITKSTIRIASAPRHRELTMVGAEKSTPRLLSPVPSAERIERRVRLAPVVKPMAKPIVKSVAKPADRAMVSAPRPPVARVLAPALRGKMGGFSAPRVEAFDSKAAPAVGATPAPRAVASARIAESTRALTPAAKYFARAASEEASRRDLSPQTSPAGGGPSTDSNVQPVPFKPAPSMTPVAPHIKISAPAPRKVAKKTTRKMTARNARLKRLALRKERQRQELRARMGETTGAPHSVIAPVSPAELMRARQQYLAERKARLGVSAAPAPEVPVVGLAPLPIPSGPLGGPSNALPPTAPGQFSPMAFEPSHPLAPLLGDPYILSLAQLKPKTEVLTPVTALKPFPVSALMPGGARGGSPRDRAAPLRGGSPRDRMGSGMASQALSYRGMPYIRGAASPNRGFDCSGLIYYLLRQRGYNPPRTAAGYRNWGQGVSKGQLKSGDLLLFANTYKRGISHIGVYLGDGKFVHAATSRTGVRVSSLNEAYYRGKYFGARRAK